MVSPRRCAIRKALLLGIGFVAVLGLTPSAGVAETIYAVTTGGALLTFDSATPGTTSSVAITGLVAGDVIIAIDLRPATGVLYGLGAMSRLYTINPTTGVATVIGSAGSFTLSGLTFGFDFNPVPDRIRVVSDADQNLRLNPNDGTLTSTDSTLNYASGDSNFGQNPTEIGVAYSNNVAGATTTTLYGIDSNLDILVIQNPPNDGTLNTVGPLGLDAAGFVGFDISGVTGTPYASLVVGGVSAFYTINLATGAATLVGTIGAGATVIGDITAGQQGPTPTPTETVTATATTTPTVTATATATTTPTVTATLSGGGPAADVPTLSGWALVAMMLLLGTLGYFVASRTTG